LFREFGPELKADAETHRVRVADQSQMIDAALLDRCLQSPLPVEGWCDAQLDVVLDLLL
jgi:hypothetical protein